MAGLTQNVREMPRGRPVCPACLVGRCSLKRQTRFVWVELDMIMVPGFPVWVCDLCGWRRFDPAAKLWLRMLLHPPGGPGSRQPMAPSRTDYIGGGLFLDFSSRREG